MQNSVYARTSTGHVVWFRLLVGLMVAAVFAVSMTVGAGEANAAPAKPVTRVFLDGDYKDKIVGEGVLKFKVYKGCHEVEAVQRRSGEVINRATVNFCTDGPSSVRVAADDESVSISHKRLN